MANETTDIVRVRNPFFAGGVNDTDFPASRLDNQARTQINFILNDDNSIEKIQGRKVWAESFDAATQITGLVRPPYIRPLVVMAHDNRDIYLYWDSQYWTVSLAEGNYYTYAELAAALETALLAIDADFSVVYAGNQFTIAHDTDDFVLCWAHPNTTVVPYYFGFTWSQTSAAHTLTSDFQVDQYLQPIETLVTDWDWGQHPEILIVATDLTHLHVFNMADSSITNVTLPDGTTDYLDSTLTKLSGGWQTGRYYFSNGLRNYCMPDKHCRYLPNSTDGAIELFEGQAGAVNEIYNQVGAISQLHYIRFGRIVDATTPAVDEERLYARVQIPTNTSLYQAFYLVDYLEFYLEQFKLGDYFQGDFYLNLYYEIPDIGYKKFIRRVEALEVPQGIFRNINTISRVANAVVTTVEDHAYSTNDIIRLQGIGGSAQWQALNNKFYTITSTGAKTFTIGVDTSAFTVAYTAGSYDFAVRGACNTALVLDEDVYFVEDNRYDESNAAVYQQYLVFEIVKLTDSLGTELRIFCNTGGTALMDRVDGKGELQDDGEVGWGGIVSSSDSTIGVGSTGNIKARVAFVNPEGYETYTEDTFYCTVSADNLVTLALYVNDIANKRNYHYDRIVVYRTKVGEDVFFKWLEIPMYPSVLCPWVSFPYIYLAAGINEDNLAMQAELDDTNIHTTDLPYTKAVWWDSRLWVLNAENPDIVYYSKLAEDGQPQPEAFDLAYNWVQLNKDGQPITGLCPMADRLLLFTETSFCPIYRYGETYKKEDMAQQNIGTLSHYSIVPVLIEGQAGAVFQGQDGHVYVTNGTDLVKASNTKLDNFVETELNKAALDKTYACWSNRYNSVIMSVCTGSNTSPDTNIIFKVTKKAFCFDRMGNDIMVETTLDDDIIIMTASGPDLLQYRAADGDYDSTAIACVWRSKDYDFGKPDMLKSFLNAEFTFKGIQDRYDITGITQAAPAVVTCVGHPYMTDDLVYIEGCLGMEELNGQTYIIIKRDANSFILSGIDSTAYTAYAAGGTAMKNYVLLVGATGNFGTAKAITGITKAPNAICNCIGHGYSTNDWVHIVNVTGMTEVNGRFFRIIWIDANNFYLNINSSGYGFVGVGGSAYKHDSTALANTYRIITAIVPANPCRVTSPGHGISVNYPVYITGVLGMTEINDHWYNVLDTPDADTITLDLDSTNYGGYTGGANGTSPGFLARNYMGRKLGKIVFIDVSVGGKVRIRTIDNDLDNGAVIYITDVAGMTELNRRFFKVEYISAALFYLRDELGADYIDGSAYKDYTDGGVYTQYKTALLYWYLDGSDHAAGTNRIMWNDYLVKHIRLSINGNGKTVSLKVYQNDALGSFKINEIVLQYQPLPGVTMF